MIAQPERKGVKRNANQIPSFFLGRKSGWGVWGKRGLVELYVERGGGIYVGGQRKERGENPSGYNRGKTKKREEDLDFKYVGRGRENRRIG